MLEFYKDWEIRPSYLGVGYDGLDPYDGEIAVHGMTISEAKEQIDTLEDGE